jgi:hypothetical protein
VADAHAAPVPVELAALEEVGERVLLDAGGSRPAMTFWLRDVPMIFARASGSSGNQHRSGGSKPWEGSS